MTENPADRRRPWVPLVFAAALAGFSFSAVSGARAEPVAIKAADYSPFAAFLAGQHAFVIGDDAQAAILLGIAASAQPQDVEIATRHILAEVNSSDFAAAAKAARARFAAGANDPLIHLILAIAAAQDGDLDAAKRHAAALSGEGMSGLAGRLLAAWAQMPEGGLEAARRELADFAKIEDLTPILALHFALMEDMAGSGRAALDQFGASLGKAKAIPSRSRELYVRLLARAGRKAEAIAFRDSLRAANGRADAALDNVIAGLPANPGGKPLRRDIRAGMAEALFTLAGLAQSEEDPGQAKLFAHLALALDPELDLAHIVLGSLYQESGRLAEAAREFSALAPRSPYAWSAGLSLADLDRRNGDIAPAIARLETLAAKKPDQTEPLVDLGDLYRGEKRFPEAATAYSRAIERIGEPTRKNWPLFFSRAIAYEQAGDWPKAEADFQQALKLSPDEAYVLNYLAYSWLEQNRNLDEALAMLKKAADLNPDDGYILDSLGWAYYRLGQFAEAATYLERAIERTPAESVVNDHLGDAYWRIGRHREAKFQWRRALETGPEPEEVPKIEKKLIEGLAE